MSTLPHSLSLAAGAIHTFIPERCLPVVGHATLSHHVVFAPAIPFRRLGSVIPGSWRLRDGHRATLVIFAISHDGPSNSRQLVGQRDDHHPRWPARQQTIDPGRDLRPIPAIADTRCRTRDQKTANLASPFFEILPRWTLPPVRDCLGVRPTQAARCRPDSNTFASTTVAAIAVAVMMPTPVSSPAVG